MTKAVLLCAIISLCSTAWAFYVPTAEDYAHSLESRFLAGESADSIRSSFETNGVFSFYEIMPYCYEFTADTNNLSNSLQDFRRKEAFIVALLPNPLPEVSSATYEQTAGRFEAEMRKLGTALQNKRQEEPDNPMWRVYLRGGTGMWSGPVEPALLLMPSNLHTKNERDFVSRYIGAKFYAYSYREILSLSNYEVTREGLYAELSTNTQCRADEMFRYVLTDKADFPTNNAAIAEKQMWRNNFVLEIIGKSCNLHADEANRALDTAYTNALASVIAAYAATAPEGLDMTQEEKAEWIGRLQSEADRYRLEVSPFRPGH